MKRQAAIVGVTPEFVRWSIRQNCPLRESVAVDSPEGTERCLRSLREADLAIRENRVCEGLAYRYCRREPVELSAHQESTFPGRVRQTVPGRPESVESAKGNENPSDLRLFAFFVDEPFSVFGGRERVAGICQNCPANVTGVEQQARNRSFPMARIVGCHGLLIKTVFGSDPEINALLSEVLDQSEFASIVSTTRHPWYGLWTSLVWDRVPLAIWSLFFQQVARRVRQPDSIERFVEALEQCAEHSLEMDVQFSPAGYSDGQNWFVEQHCPVCKAPCETSNGTCSECGRRGSPISRRKRKVLGKRPYVEIETLLHPAMIEETRNKIEQQWIDR